MKKTTVVFIFLSTHKHREDIVQVYKSIMKVVHINHIIYVVTFENRQVIVKLGMEGREKQKFWVHVETLLEAGL